MFSGVFGCDSAWRESTEWCILTGLADDNVVGHCSPVLIPGCALVDALVGLGLLATDIDDQCPRAGLHDHLGVLVNVEVRPIPGPREATCGTGVSSARILGDSSHRRAPQGEHCLKKVQAPQTLDEASLWLRSEPQCSPVGQQCNPSGTDELWWEAVALNSREWHHTQAHTLTQPYVAQHQTTSTKHSKTQHVSIY